MESYVTFCVWILSLSIMVLGFIHAVAWVSTSEFFLPDTSQFFATSWLPNNFIQLLNQLLELAQTPQMKYSVPQDCPHMRNQLHMGCPGYPHFCPGSYKFRGSCDPLPHLSLIPHWDDSSLQIGRVLDLLVCCRDHSSAQTWKRCRHWSVVGLSGHTSCQHFDVSINPEALWTLLFRGFGGVDDAVDSIISHWSLNSISCPSFLLDVGHGPESSNLLTIGWSFLLPAPILKPSKSHQESAH